MVEKVNDNIKRFKSCFLCCVEMHDKFIMLEDSNKDRFYIDREDKVALEVNKLIANPAVGNASENEHKDNSASNTTNESKEG